ncbi:MAG: hypothetical protein ACK45I_09990 [Bacteroidota bacterium]
MNRLIPSVALCLLMLASPNILFAQRKIKEVDPQRKNESSAPANEKEAFKDRLLFGGNAWMSFGTNFSLFLLQPQVAYRVNNSLMTGIGGTYMHLRESYVISGKNYVFTDNIFGINLFARQNIAGPVFAYTEYAPTNFNSFNSFGDRKRVWGHALNIGGGYSQSFNGAGAYIIVLYVVLWQQVYSTNDPNSYARSLRLSPWDIRFGVLF